MPTEKSGDDDDADDDDDSDDDDVSTLSLARQTQVKHVL